METGKKPEETLPLTHITYYVLLALADGDSHGYAVIKSVRERSASAINPGTGTFYSAIKRMLDEELIESVERPEDAPGNDQRRRYYSLTAFGAKVLGAETKRLEDLVCVARATNALAR